MRSLGDLSPAEVRKLKRKWLPEYGSGTPHLTGRQLDDPDLGRRMREALMILEQEVRKGEERLEAVQQDLLRV